jgi:glutaredoxin
VYEERGGLAPTLLGAGALIAAAAALAFALSVRDDLRSVRPPGQPPPPFRQEPVVQELEPLQGEVLQPAPKPLQTAAPERPRKPTLERERERDEPRPAERGVVVVMYSTSWCPSCVAARRYMDQKGIAYVEHDIDESPPARAAMQRLNPRGSVPTIDVDGEVLVGFGPQHLEYALEKAARRRAGI